MTPNPFFNEFRKNPAIASIAKNKRWTISTSEKMPIDMVILIKYGTIAGAVNRNEKSLISLDELNDAVPNASNYAYFLNAVADGIMVLDIEPRCPDDVKQKLLKLPYLYGEVSMSGKGIHLIFPLPKNIIQKYPACVTKTNIQDKTGWYEVLIQHYVTFTAKQLPPRTETEGTFEEIFEPLAKAQKETVRKNVTVDEIPRVETTYTDKILEALMYYSRKYFTKTPDDYKYENSDENDPSKYEFAYLAWLYTKLTQYLDITTIKNDHEYTDSEKAWFLYMTAKEYLPYRPKKHDQTRFGLPWLLFEAREVMSKCDPYRNQKNKKKKDKKEE